MRGAVEAGRFSRKSKYNMKKNYSFDWYWYITGGNDVKIIFKSEKKLLQRPKIQTGVLLQRNLHLATPAFEFRWH